MFSISQSLRRLALVARPGDGWRTGAVLALFAATVQGVFLLETFRCLLYRYPVVDAATYYYQALGILQGQGTAGAFWQPPGYPYLLALFCGLGNGNILVARIAQALILAPLSAVLLWRVSRRVLPPGGSFAAAIVISLTGPLLFYQSQFLAAAPAAVLVTTILLLALRAMEQPSAARWLLVGMVNGLAMLVVATTAALVPVLAVFAWITPATSVRLRRASRMAALLFGALLVITPVTLRNYNACGQWVWISHNGGTNFYVGNNRCWKATLTMQPVLDWDRLMRLPYLQYGVKNPVDADRHFARMAWQDARNAPAAFVKRLAVKTAVFWHGREIPRNLDIYGWRDSSYLLRATVWRRGLNFPCGLLIPLALIGACALLRRREGLLLIGTVVAFGLLVALFFPCSRYRVPVLPIIVLLACAGVQALVAAIRARAWRTAGILGVLALMAGVTANLPFAWPTDSIRYDAHLWTAIGVAADIRTDLSTAKTCYEAAIRRDPKLADAHFALATIYGRLQDPVRSAACCEAAIAARIDHDKAQVNLAILLAQRGQLAEALRHIQLAEIANPLNAEAFVNHAAILQQAGRDAQALEALGRAAAIDTRYQAQYRALEQSLGKMR